MLKIPGGTIWKLNPMLIRKMMENPDGDGRGGCLLGAPDVAGPLDTRCSGLQPLPQPHAQIRTGSLKLGILVPELS